MSALGTLGLAATIAPLLMTVGPTALQLPMTAIQAYVFAILTCMYLRDAMNPGLRAPV